ncbi:MAG: hypothetical protein HYX63_05035 [Gammaproteobacteria bacterium]|nr:hypothetical protein [Gammaproteobacteria bacterium]
MRTSTHIANAKGTREWRMPLAAAALTLGMSGAALAEPHGFYGGYGGYGSGYGHHQRYCPERRAPVVVEQYYYPQDRMYYAPPQVVYQPPPQVYYYQEPAYRQSYAPPANYGYSSGYGGGNRLMSSALLGAAGGFIGSQVGHGSSRAAATAAGAVAGWVLGGRGGW